MFPVSLRILPTAAGRYPASLSGSVPDLSALRRDLEYAKRGYARYAAYPAATLAGLRDLTLEEPDTEDVVRRIYAEATTGSAGRSSVR